jgi:hypothetical protein
MAFEAKYQGRCASSHCRYGDNEIRAGDDVEYYNDELMHRECANSTRKGEPPFCKDCNTFHRGDCL